MVEGHILIYGKGASFRSGWESQCLPYLYTGYFIIDLDKKYIQLNFFLLNWDLHQVSNKLWIPALTQYYGITLHTTYIRGGWAGTVWFKLPACYHQNLGIFREVWMFQNNLQPKNIPYPGQIPFWKYNGKSIFFIFF